ncbi:hypothetical protein Pen01_77010 [Phytomonospora endophytica]|nr:hypothetical protein Pen01_77010 [Phytomonospora endophytica]
MFPGGGELVAQLAHGRAAAEYHFRPLTFGADGAGAAGPAWAEQRDECVRRDSEDLLEDPDGRYRIGFLRLRSAVLPVAETRGRYSQPAFGQPVLQAVKTEATGVDGGPQGHMERTVS